MEIIHGGGPHEPRTGGAPRAFVAGATGYTGQAVVAALLRRGIETVAHVRPDAPRLAEWRARFAAGAPGAPGASAAAVDATPWEEEAMAATLARLRPTHVFALLGTTRARGRRGDRARGAPADYRTVDYGLTVLLLRAAARAGGRPRFVYLSAAGVGGRGGGAYLRARRDVEAELARSGLPHLIARPAFITGPDRAERRPAERLAARAVDAALGLAARLGARRLRERWRSRTAGEVAEAVVAAALAPPPPPPGGPAAA
jgi:uncharacterized protein YbjT (DUF2867 family)